MESRLLRRTESRQCAADHLAAAALAGRSQRLSKADGIRGQGRVARQSIEVAMGPASIDAGPSAARDRPEPDALVKILAPLFQKLIDGDRPTRSQQAR